MGSGSVAASWTWEARGGGRGRPRVKGGAPGCAVQACHLNAAAAHQLARPLHVRNLAPAAGLGWVALPGRMRRRWKDVGGRGAGRVLFLRAPCFS